MKKGILFLLCFQLAIISCTEDKNSNDSYSKQDLEPIAAQYGYTINEAKQTDSIFRVGNISELKNILQSIKSNFDTPKYQSFGITIDKKNIAKYDNLIEENRRLMVKEIQKRSMHRTTADGEDPPYEHSVTVYFDNSFPCSNVYVTIGYNTNQYGQITGAGVTSGSYGYSLGNTYSQTGVNLYYNNQTIAFQLTGQFTSSVGIGSFSLSNSNIVQYTGYYNPPGGGGFGSEYESDDESGRVRQSLVDQEAP